MSNHEVTFLGYKPPVEQIVALLREQYPAYHAGVSRPQESGKDVDFLVIDSGFNQEGPVARSYAVVVSAFWNRPANYKEVSTVAEDVDLAVQTLQARMGNRIRHIEGSGAEYGVSPDTNFPFWTMAFDVLTSANKTLRVRIKR